MDVKNQTRCSKISPVFFPQTSSPFFLSGLKKCCDFQLQPVALLRAAKPQFALALGAAWGPPGAAVLYSRGGSKWRRIRRPEKLLPLFRKVGAVVKQNEVILVGFL